MNVVLLGATGKVGGPILAELLDRGHRVTAVVREASRLPAESAALAHRVGDVFDPGVLDAALPGADAVVCAVALRDPAQRERTPELLLRTVSAAAARARVRLLTMGGAGSLRTEGGVDLVDTPGFPEVAKPESLGFRAALHELLERAPAGLDWTMLSPPASIEVAGPRTGRYRTADDTLLTDEDGASRISAADLAAALVDELENPKHPRARFTAAY
ncbi:MAG TPA: NAD(P)H-binding protein [Pseudonocardia sp.]|nr:NAD(P)H-binding protein [Pseudonocardia sp.]